MDKIMVSVIMPVYNGNQKCPESENGRNGTFAD